LEVLVTTALRRSAIANVSPWLGRLAVGLRLLCQSPFVYDFSPRFNCEQTELDRIDNGQLKPRAQVGQTDLEW